jgi:LysM repeat protein
MFSQKHTFFRNLLLSFVALVTVFAGLGLAFVPAQAATCSQYHTVERGEYLVLIAREYNTDWRTLADINNLKDPTLIYAGQRLCVSTSGAVVPDEDSSSNSDVPTIDVVAAVEDKEVTIQAQNFPARVRFDVLMGEMGTKGVDGIWVDRITSARDGDFETTFEIPRALRGDNRIAIRLESVSGGWFSYNWFYNATFGQSRGGVIDVDVDIDEEANLNVSRVSFGKAADIYQGNAGVYMPSSNYDARVVVARHFAYNYEMPRGLHLVQNPLEFRVVDENGDRISEIFGLNYVYFNLSRENRRAYDNGDLAIYHYNPAVKGWERCEFQMLIDTKNGPNGRLACVAQDFGLFALAESR